MWGWQIVKSFRVDEDYDESMLEVPQLMKFKIKFREVVCGPRCTAAIDCMSTLTPQCPHGESLQVLGDSTLGV